MQYVHLITSFINWSKHWHVWCWWYWRCVEKHRLAVIPCERQRMPRDYRLLHYGNDRYVYTASVGVLFSNVWGHMEFEFIGLWEAFPANWAHTRLVLSMGPSHVTVVGSMRGESFSTVFTLKRKRLMWRMNMGRKWQTWRDIILHSFLFTYILKWLQTFPSHFLRFTLVVFFDFSNKWRDIHRLSVLMLTIYFHQWSVFFTTHLIAPCDQTTKHQQHILVIISYI